MNKKKLTIVIVLAVVAVVVLGVIGFSHRAKAPEVAADGMAPTSTTSPIVVVTSSTLNSTKVSITLGTSTLKFYANGSFSFNYPASWSIAQYLPFLITNFNNNYAAGGVIPKGGALIFVTTTTVEQGYLPSIMTTQLMNATNVTTTTLSVDGVACPAAAYEAVYGPSATSKSVSVYCERGTELWEIYLSYNANDTAMATHVSDFNGVLDSMKFLP